MQTESCPIIHALTAPPARWWCIRSKSTGQLATVGPLGEGAVLAYHDRNDAEADAAALQMSQSLMLWEPMELPATPPAVCLPDGYRREAKTVAWTMRVMSRDTGEVLSVRVAGGSGVSERAVDELSSMIHIASSHWLDSHEILDVSEICLGEIRESQPTKKKGAA